MTVSIQMEMARAVLETLATRYAFTGEREDDAKLRAARGPDAGAPRPARRRFHPIPWSHRMSAGSRRLVLALRAVLFAQPASSVCVAAAAEPDGRPALGPHSKSEAHRPTPWPNTPPPDLPLERSKAMSRITVTGRYANYTRADFWNVAWAADGNLYAGCGTLWETVPPGRSFNPAGYNIKAARQQIAKRSPRACPDVSASRSTPARLS
jgi:hypothetical protein